METLKSCHFHQSIFDDIINNGKHFSNETSTTTTHNPLSHHYLSPLPLPYPGTMHVHHRQVFAAIAAVGGILGTFLGIFNDHKIKEIKNGLFNLSDQQNILTSIVNKHEHELSTLHAQLASLTNGV